MFVVTERLEKLFCERGGRTIAAYVGHRLTAAGLIFGEIDIDSKAFQDPHGCDTDIRIELVDIARNKKANAHGGLASTVSVTQAVVWNITVRLLEKAGKTVLARSKPGLSFPTQF